MCGDYNLRREKRYVEVDVRFTPDGKIRPLAINYDKAHTYGIDRVLAVKHGTSYIFFSHSITSQKNAKQTQSHTKITPKGCYLWIWFDYTPTLWRCQLRICLHFGERGFLFHNKNTPFCGFIKTRRALLANHTACHELFFV